jgi:5'-nucleotidase
MHKPLILITNDDGINSKGLRGLVEYMQEIGNVFVVAPDSPQSGMGHAITLDSTLSVQKVNLHGLDNTFEAYSCSGTPADCVKLALQELLPQKPDICVSGINHGSNASINVIYSGTMSAAMEAGIEGIPAIGFSLCDFDYDADFSRCKEGVQLLVREALEKGMPKDTVLNVNFPKPKGEESYKGIRVCRQARANWKEKFDKRQSPSGKDYYWLTGDFRLLDQGEDTDINALEDYCISVVPCQFDLTAHHSIATLNSWNIHDT